MLRLQLTLAILLFIANIGHAQQDRPKVFIGEVGHANGCETGFSIEEINVFSPIGSEEIEILFYVQNLNQEWEQVLLNCKGTSKIEMPVSGCHYTGNYYFFAYYKHRQSVSLPNAQQIKEHHHAKVPQAYFEWNQSKGSVAQLYTVAGEEVELTLVLELAGGRKVRQVYRQTGSGPIEIDLNGLSFSGKYHAEVKTVSSPEIANILASN